MGRPGAGAPGLTSVGPLVFETFLAGPLGTHARSRTGVGPGNIGGNRPPAGHTCLDRWAGPCSRSDSCTRRACTAGGCGACRGSANSYTWSSGTGARYATGCGSCRVTLLWRHRNGADQPPLGG